MLSTELLARAVQADRDRATRDRHRHETGAPAVRRHPVTVPVPGVVSPSLTRSPA